MQLKDCQRYEQEVLKSKQQYQQKSKNIIDELASQFKALQSLVSKANNQITTHLQRILLEKSSQLQSIHSAAIEALCDSQALKDSFTQLNNMMRQTRFGRVKHQANLHEIDQKADEYGYRFDKIIAQGMPSVQPIDPVSSIFKGVLNKVSLIIPSVLSVPADCGGIQWVDFKKTQTQVVPTVQKKQTASNSGKLSANPINKTHVKVNEETINDLQIFSIPDKIQKPKQTETKVLASTMIAPLTIVPKGASSVGKVAAPVQQAHKIQDLFELFPFTDEQGDDYYDGYDSYLDDQGDSGQQDVFFEDNSY